MVEAQPEDGSQRLQKGNYGEDKKQRYPPKLSTKFLVILGRFCDF
jgi:hypothetical protein